MTSPDTSAVMHNVEGHDDFDVAWPWLNQTLTPGITTVLRVKNESRSMPRVLPGMLRATDRVVVVDNQSDDGTADVARQVAAELGMSDRLVVKDYPFDVSRCGLEHLWTPDRSVHSLAYFYNWSFSHVSTTYSMKWDGDMVLTPEGVAILRDLGWQLDGDVLVTIPRHPLFVESELGRVSRSGHGQHRALRVPDGVRLRTRQGVRVGAQAAPRGHHSTAPARRPVRRAEVPGLR